MATTEGCCNIYALLLLQYHHTKLTLGNCFTNLELYRGNNERDIRGTQAEKQRGGNNGRDTEMRRETRRERNKMKQRVKPAERNNERHGETTREKPRKEQNLSNTISKDVQEQKQ